MLHYVLWQLCSRRPMNVRVGLVHTQSTILIAETLPGTILIILCLKRECFGEE